MEKKNILFVMFMVFLSQMAFATDISVTSEIGNPQSLSVSAMVTNNPPVVGNILLCDGTCGYGKSIDPASQFTIQITLTDPDGQDDLNLASLKLEWYTTADSNGGTPDWDAKAKSPPTTGTRDGCEQTGTTYCLQVNTTDWTTKFVDGLIDVYVYVKDDAGIGDSNEAVGLATINKAYGTTQDTTSGTYTGSPYSIDNAFLSEQTANTYIGTTHNGNCAINVTAEQTNLTYLTNMIGDDNISWNLTDNVGESIPFTGGADAIKSSWERGTDPTPAPFNLWAWLNVPPEQPAGEYLGTLTYESSAV